MGVGESAVKTPKHKIFPHSSVKSEQFPISALLRMKNESLLLIPEKLVWKQKLTLTIGTPKPKSLRGSL